MYEHLLELDQVKINFSSTGSHILNVILALIMFGVALGIRVDEFRYLFKKPKSLIAGCLSQIILLPAMTFIIIIIFYRILTPTVAMGMILVASCPGGNISNFISSLAKAKVELSVSMTAISTIAAIITTPFNFAFWGGLYINFVARHSTELLQPLTIDAMQMFHTVVILLGIPLVLGLSCAHYFPVFSKKISPWMQRFSIVAFIAMIVLAFYSNIDIFINYIFYIFFIVLIHNALANLTGFTTGTIFKVKNRERRAITIETGIQNSGLGLALLLNPKIFPQDVALGGMLMVTAWWGIWHIISGLAIGSYWHYKPAKDELISNT
jgi:bile acid:Na+ symporter, BASS family